MEKSLDIKKYLDDKRKLIDAFIREYFDAPLKPDILRDSIVYSLTAGGKRIRPILALASYEACGKNPADIITYASALEFIHTYSLIHDDLPAMDDDDLRRGKLTNHKVFGEGIAILAGDSLLTEAFYLLSSTPPSVFRIPQSAIVGVIHEVALASGAHGMIGGQAEDILSEDKMTDSDNISFIHSHKTGALITASVRMGGILADATKEELHALTRYAENTGLAFQIIDDILDVEGKTEVLGKTAGSDKKKKKMTYPGLFGIDLSMEKAEELIKSAVNALNPFSKKADPLREIALYILHRKS